MEFLFELYEKYTADLFSEPKIKKEVKKFRFKKIKILNLNYRPPPWWEVNMLCSNFLFYFFIGYITTKQRQ